MEMNFSVLKIVKIQGELPRKHDNEYKAEGLKDIDRYILNRLRSIGQQATMDDLCRIIEDVIKCRMFSKTIRENFSSEDAFRSYCKNKYQGKVQVICLNGTHTKVTGFDIIG